ncbi:MAG: hypothetical protein HY608_04385 [Planctomycetes bacterium]|nr:hypothetical protein [Planctomycetota bacterium]
MSSRGIALVLVSLLLVLLVAVATVLVRMAGAERAMTRVRLEQARAALLARSGVECAMARLPPTPEFPVTRTAANQADDWTYRDGEYGVPLERSHNPSYAAGEPYVDVTADGRYAPPPGSADGFTPPLHDRDRDRTHSGFSGRLRGTLQPWGDTYALRIESEEGKIHVNGGYLSAPDHNNPLAGYNAVLVRILNTLGTVKEDANGDNVLDAGEDWDGDGILDPAPIGIANLGDLVLSQRPVGGYTSLAQLAARTGITKDPSAFLTCHGWVDRSVIRPQATSAEIPNPVILADCVVARGGPPALEPAGRAPVNMNHAHRAVLQALLRDLQGVYRQPAQTSFSKFMHTRETPFSAGITSAEASAIAHRIAQARQGAEDVNRNGTMDPGEDVNEDGFLDSPFRTWEQFSAFADALAYRGVLPPQAAHDANATARVPYLMRDIRADLLKANFNPNSDLNKNNPDVILHREVDKSDLLTYSTEFSLHPISGTYTIASLGRVRDVAGAVRATTRSDAAIRCYVPLRQTSQRDFVAGRALLSCVTPMTGGPPLAATFRTFGARAALGGAANVGLSLMTYPEPYYALPARAAPFDGQIGLATTELPNNPNPANVRFVHRFTNTWTADFSASGATTMRPVAITEEGGTQIDAFLQTDVTRSTFDPTSGRPNTFVPDGVHIQSRRIPMYASVGNIPPRHGVASYWVKPGILRRPIQLDFSVMQASRGTDGAQTQVLCVGRYKGAGGAPNYGILVENTSDLGESDSWHERQWHFDNGLQFSTPSGSSDEESRHLHRWLLVTAFWDIDNNGDPDPSDNARTWMRGARASTKTDGVVWVEGVGVVLMNLNPAYVKAWSGRPVTDLANTSRRLVLGGAMMYDSEPNVDSNQTLDEFATYDFGGAEGAAKTSAATMADLRYQDGRYYKRNDGQFTSTDLLAQLPAGTARPLRVERLYWTEVLPRAPFPTTEPVAPRTVVWDPVLLNSRIGVQLLEGAAVLHDTETLAPLDYEAAARVGRPIAAGPLRYRLTFKPTPDWSVGDPRYMDAPILETPFFDDITVLVRPRGYPRVVAWAGE